MRHCFFHSLCCLLLCGLFGASVCAQISPGSWSVEQWTSEEGLGQNTIRALAEDGEGYLWIGTFNGLNRFDGASFEAFNRGNTPVFKSNIISDLITDAEGRLWISTDEGVYCSENGHFREVSDVASDHTLLATLSDGTLIAVTQRGQVYQFQHETLEMVRANGIIDLIEDVVVDAEDYIWVLANRGIACASLRADTSFVLPGKYSRLALGKDGALYASSGPDLYELKVGKAPVIRLTDPDGENIQAFTVETDGIIWSTATRLKAEGGTDVTAFRTWSENPQLSLFYTDREGNYWGGSLSEGLYRISRQLFRPVTFGNGITKVVTSVTERQDGTIISGHNCGGYSQITSDTVISQSPHVYNSCVWSALEDHRGRLWLGSYNGGLYRMTGEIQDFGSPPLPNGVVLGLFEDSQNRIWVGTAQGVVWFTDNDPARAVTLDSITSRVVAFAEDASGTIYLGASDGLWVVRSGATVPERFAGLPRERILTLFKDQEGVLWISQQYHGLHRYDGQQIESLEAINYPDFQEISGLMEDDYGRFWTTSNSGVRVVYKKEVVAAMQTGAYLPMQHFTARDGMSNTECNGGFFPSICKDRQGRIWIPTITGLDVVDPAQLQPIPLGRPLITGARMKGQRLMSVDTLKLPYGQQDVEIHYTLPHFKNPENLNFSYRIRALDTAWTAAANRRVAYYNALPAGSYLFELRCRGSVEVATLLITVEVPYHQTIWFYLLLIGGVALLIFVAMRIRIRHVKRQAAQRIELDRKMSTLELKALQSQMNPHFIFNCLNSIQHLFLINDDVAANEYLGRFSGLLRQVLEHSKQTFISIEEEIALLERYLSLEKLQFNHRFEYVLEKADGLDANRHLLPAMLLQPHVENALQHGIRHLEGHGKVQVLFRKEEDRLIIEVKDNGVGREAAAEIEARDDKPRSRGLELIQDRIEVLRHSSQMHITQEVIDEKTEGGEAAGTTVRLTLPLKLAEKS